MDIPFETDQLQYILTRLHVLFVDDEDAAAVLADTAGSPADASLASTAASLQDVASNSADPSPASLQKALTADATLEAYGYRLDAASILQLARLYDAGSTLDLRNYMECCSLQITGTPMYPDFPSQVMSMDEAEYRLHQSLHYLSTYDVEALAALLLGAEIDVRNGWMPDVPETPKTQEQKTLLEAKVLQLCVGEKALADVAFRTLACRNERVGDEDSDILARLPVPEWLTADNVPFHENLYLLLGIELFACSEDSCSGAAGTSTQLFLERAERFRTNPSDFIKFLFWLRLHYALCGGAGNNTGNDVAVRTVEAGFVHIDDPKRWKLRTSQRRALTAFLEGFPADVVAENFAMHRYRAKKVLELISYDRFAKSDAHKAVVADLRDGKLRSWNATKEALYAAGDAAAVIAHLQQRPGIMLREITHLLRIDATPEQILDAFGENPPLSRATLLQNLAVFAGDKFAKRRLTGLMEEKGLSKKAIRDALQNARFEAAIRDALQNAQFEAAILPVALQSAREYGTAFAICRELLRRTLVNASTPLKGKRVFLDEGPYSLKHSVILKNADADFGDYLWPGLAYRIPEDARYVRFFLFWDHAPERVDLDLHATTDTGIHVGWNSAYKDNGLVMSGDVTTSDNSVEYLDVDLDEAAKFCKYVQMKAIFFTGYKFQTGFRDIRTAYAGLMVLDSIGRDVKLYSPANCVMNIQLNKASTRTCTLARVDVENRCIVSCLDAKVPDSAAWFSAQDYVDLLLACQGASLVSSPEEADVVLSVGKADGEGLSLIDEGWFL